MGGGDLNLKKSWHPQTYHNIEKVWKAEQKALAEKRKIDQLKRELEEERAREEVHQQAYEAGIAKKKDPKLSWMYQGTVNTVDREEFLLGKPVNQTLMPTNGTEDELKVGTRPGANFMAPTDDVLNNFRDMSQKIRDDPMLAIKKREQAKLREIRDNPLKMAELRKMMEKSKKKHKKHKDGKKKKKKHSRRDSDSDEQDSGTIHRPRDRSEDRDVRHPRRRRSRSRSLSRERHRSPPRYRRRRSRSRSRSPRRYNRDHRHRDRSPIRRRQSPRRASPPRAAEKRRSDPADDDAERERRLKEMMQDAEVHEKERAERIARQHKRDAEKERGTAVPQEEATFLRDMNKEAFQSNATGNLSDRLKRNVHYLQKTELSSTKFTSR